MKKTLVTLAAIAVAVAPVASAAISTGSTFTPDANNDFSFTLVLDLDAALSAGSRLGNWDNPGSVTTNNENGWWTEGVVFWASDSYEGKMFLAPSQGGRVTPTTINAATVTDGVWATYDADDAWSNGNIVITYTFDNGVKDADGVRTSTMSVYVLKNDEGSLVQETLTYTFTNSDWDFDTYSFQPLTINAPAGVIEGIYYHSGVLTAAEAKTFATKAIPEPTTATLSLLALAGLAARRRRK